MGLRSSSVRCASYDPPPKEDENGNANSSHAGPAHGVPWNKGKVTGQKPPLKPREVWAIRVRLQISNRVRDLALFNLAIDSKLRGCDLVHLCVEDVVQDDQVRTRALVAQRKTGAPVQFEITEQARAAIATWVRGRTLRGRTGFSRAGSTGPNH